MFGFNQRHAIIQKHWMLNVSDAVSGLLFVIVGLYAYNLHLYIIAFLACSVGSTTVIHLFYPNYFIRLVDYALAVTFVVICLELVIKSNFSYPFSVIAAICCAIAFVLYALHQRNRHDWNSYYFFWHVFAFATTMSSLIAFSTSIQ